MHEKKLDPLAALPALLPGWYAQNKRALPWRLDTNPYRIWISEIMLQQTRVEAVREYFIRFTDALPHVAALAAIPEQQLLKLWEGLGYYSRARNLQKAARMMIERYSGRLPDNYEALLTLPGIGPYTAGAIASIAFGIPVPAVDGNVLRVFSRYTADHTDISDPAQKKYVTAALQKLLPTDDPGGFNQALMELGALICLPNGAPACAACPLLSSCEGFRQEVAAQLPVKAARRARRIETKTVLLLASGGLLALRRRPSKGLLAGMWELPYLEGEQEIAQVIREVRALGLSPLRVEPAGRTKHIFTHLEWEMTGFLVTLEDTPPTDPPVEADFRKPADPLSAPLVWADAGALADRYPLPSAFAYFLRGWGTGVHR